MPHLSRRDEARPGRRPSEGQYPSMAQLQGGHDGRGLGREWFLLPVAHVQAEIKKSFIERARLALPRAVPIQQLRAFPVFNQSFGCRGRFLESGDDGELHALIFERIVTQLILRRWAG